jgi:hypothetical protein
MDFTAHGIMEFLSEAVRHEREISNAGRLKTGVERDKCKPVLLRLSLARNLENHLFPSMGPNGGSVAPDSEFRPEGHKRFFQMPVRVLEEMSFINLFRQNPVLTSSLCLSLTYVYFSIIN